MSLLKVWVDLTLGTRICPFIMQLVVVLRKERKKDISNREMKIKSVVHPSSMPNF
jgi:hypothetical protein